MNKILLLSVLFLFSIFSVAWAQQPPTKLAQGDIAVQNFFMDRVANQVVVGMQLNLEALHLKADRFIAYTPVITGVDGQQLALQPLVIAGRRQHIVFEREGNKQYPGAIELRRHNGKPQQVDYLQSVPFASWMSGGNLQLIEDLCGCGKQLATDVAQFPIFDFHPEEGIVLALVEPEVQATKVRQEEGSAYLDFPVNQTVIYPDYRRNPVELQKIIGTIDLIKDDPFITITDISIHGYASPEGPYSNNARLAAGRAEALKEYVRKQYAFSDSLFHVASTPEDWEGLRKLVAVSDLSDKDQLLKVIDGTLQPDAKDAEMKRKFSATYKFMLANWYPALRHSDYVVQYVVRPFNVVEATELLYTRPQLLSLQEIFMVAQTYPVDSSEYQEVFETAVRLFPDDPTANLNVAIAAINRKDWPAAKRALQKAGNSPAALHARGVMLLWQGDLNGAEPLLQQAHAAGIVEASSNLLILQELQKID